MKAVRECIAATVCEAGVGVEMDKDVSKVILFTASYSKVAYCEFLFGRGPE